MSTLYMTLMREAVCYHEDSKNESQFRFLILVLSTVLHTSIIVSVQNNDIFKKESQKGKHVTDLNHHVKHEKKKVS